MPARSRIIRASRLLPLLLVLGLTTVVQAQFEYMVENGTVTITGYTGPGGDVTIPDTISGLPVTGIGIDAFYEDSSLTSITIPDSVTYIGERTFQGCTSLTAITVDAPNPVYSSLDGVVFDKGQTTFMMFPPGRAGAYTIPDSVTSIGGGAFSGCTSLTSVTIGNGVTSIGNWAFAGSGLTSVTIPDSVTSIEPYAFRSCSSLTSITIPDSVRSIGLVAFSGCTGLTNVTIGNSVTSIGQYAFASCTGLTSVTIPYSVKSIDGGVPSTCAAT